MGFFVVHRVNVTLSDSDYEILKSYASIMGRSPTRLVGDMLKELIPSFSGVVEAAKIVNDDRNLALNKLQTLLLNGIYQASGVGLASLGEPNDND